MDFGQLNPSIASQFDWGNTDDHSARTKVINIVVISTTFTIVGIRTLIRIGIIRKLALDDSMPARLSTCRGVLTNNSTHNTRGAISDSLLGRSSLWCEGRSKLPSSLADRLPALQFGLGKHVWLAATSFSEDIPHVRQIIEVSALKHM